ncbi:DUF2007 domain-containing protein [Alistipes sp. ZOR0009]|uniref:putative signal transducing protein n=1 Tax=Alistipes sp. ZOR0009 TaxID=1339253 RepID=UPI0006481394|nr:DUF2007 domain-containing protein [Alistipes sp. ZOR0009]
MENWITVISFTYPQEAYLAKAKLESEGIEVTIKDDLTAQVNNFYSNAIGGVKVQVKETDVEQAMQALLEAGYIKEETTPTPSFISEFDKKTSRLPLIGTLTVELRFIILITILIMAIILPVIFLSV